MSDNSNGFNEAPFRYMAQGRETVDRMRDEAYAKAERIFSHTADPAVIQILADHLFTFACETHRMKYMDRAGLKAGESYDSDMNKALWWATMASHVYAPEIIKDPRSERAGFVPYARPRSIEPHLGEKIELNQLSGPVPDSMLWRGGKL